MCERVVILVLAALVSLAVACGDGTSVERDAGSSNGEMCMHFATTVEGCQLGGPSPGVCPQAPKGWNGAQAPGEACGSGTECAGIVCKCDQPVMEWYAGVCACGVCASYEVACAAANVANCEQISPP